MPNRILREGLLDSVAFNSLSEEAQLLYLRLFLVVDDFACYEADPRKVRSRCYPIQVDNYSIERVSEILTEIGGAKREDGTPLVLFYEVDGRRYLQIQKFGQTRRAMKNKYPLPPGLPSIDDPPFGTTEESTEQEQWFNEWWKEYWRHVGKKAAHTSFCRRVKTAEDFQLVMKATRAQKPEIVKRDEQYWPHGATWLNQERWNDEVNQSQQAQSKYRELKEW